MVSPEGACAAYYNYGRMTRSRVHEVEIQAGLAMTAGQGAPPGERERQDGSGGWVADALREHDEAGPQEQHHGGPSSREQQVLDRIDRARRRRPRVREERITMSHGAGGKATHTLIEAIFLDAFRNPLLEPLGDSALLELGGARVALTTDSFVVAPLFFPGGDIGDLAVNGTVNDLAMSGATPLYLSAGFILEEGFPVADLTRITASMRDAAAAAGVSIVTGDTKVVQKGKADGCYINTAGVGLLTRDQVLGLDQARPGDAILVSGPVGDHGITIMLARGELDIEADIVSDTAPLAGLAATLLDAVPGVRALRDATRGGVATILNEIATAAEAGIVVSEDAIPVRAEVRGASELLGIDPMYVACEGRLVAVVDGGQADGALAALRGHPLGAQAAVIGGSPPTRPGSSSSRPPSAAPGSWTCWSATRCRASADAGPVHELAIAQGVVDTVTERLPGRHRHLRPPGDRRRCPGSWPTRCGSASTWPPRAPTWPARSWRSPSPPARCHCRGCGTRVRARRPVRALPVRQRRHRGAGGRGTADPLGAGGGLTMCATCGCADGGVPDRWSRRTGCTSHRASRRRRAFPRARPRPPARPHGAPCREGAGQERRAGRAEPCLAAAAGRSRRQPDELARRGQDDAAGAHRARAGRASWPSR